MTAMLKGETLRRVPSDPFFTPKAALVAEEHDQVARCEGPLAALDLDRNILAQFAGLAHPPAHPRGSTQHEHPRPPRRRQRRVDRRQKLPRRHFDENHPCRGKNRDQSD